MRTFLLFLGVLLASAVAADVRAGSPPDAALDNWPQFRGPLGTGVAPRGNPPAAWSEAKNIKWKTSIPGLGHASPIVWGDSVFLTTAAPFGDAVPAPKELDHEAHDNRPASHKQRFIALAIHRDDGRILWQKTLREEQPHEGVHETGTWASNSPVTDGEYLFAYFGSRGLYCLDLDGHLLWQKDFAKMRTRHGHGEGSSPALYGNTLVVNWDHQGDSFVVALDKRTGKELWRTPRDEITSWSTPLIVEYDGKPQVVIAATNRVRGYDLASGNVIWECAGLSRNVVATPLASEGIVYVANSYDWQAMLAIDLSKAKGDITGTDAVVWKRDRDTPYVPSPLLYGERLYFTKHLQGFLTCVDARTGKTRFGPVRLPNVDYIFASPVAANHQLYITCRNGNTLVVKDGDEFVLLAQNRLDDSFSATPAVVGDEIFLRGERFLYCIAERKDH